MNTKDRGAPPLTPLLSFLKTVFFLWFLLFCGVSSAEYPVPEIKKDCSACHVSHEMAGTGLKKPLSGLCLDCHPEKGGEKSDHVINISPKPDMMPGIEAKGLILQEGKITCATCHDPHGSGYVKMLRAGRGSSAGPATGSNNLQ